MPAKTLLVWSDELLQYNFGPTHPMAPVRLGFTRSLIGALELLKSVEVADAPVAPRAELELVHDPEFISRVEAEEADLPYGLGTEDDPVFAGMHEAAARIAGGTVRAAKHVWEGAPSRAVNFAGGMHHAMPGKAAGFCVYNDAAIAIQWLLDHGAERVAYLDIDAHHGDGVERAFWDDPRVLTISIHQTGMSLFPGTGFAQDVGGPRARGTAVNVALPARTRDEGWLRALVSVAEPLLRQFDAQVLVSQHGCDSHYRDPLTQLEISVDAQRIAAEMIRAWASEYAGGRWLAVGGGGYDIASTVPRVWANLVAIASEQDLDPATPLPRRWRSDLVAAGFEVAETMSDERQPQHGYFAEGYDPADPIDRVIMATRRAVFPEHGLDPMLD